MRTAGTRLRLLYARRAYCWFAGLTWKGLALITLLCLLNSLRRNSYGFFEMPLDRWVLDIGEQTGTGLIALLPIMLAAVATYNRAPSIPRVRYPALALAILIASAVSTAMLAMEESRGTFDFSENGGLSWWIVGTWPRYALLGALLTAVFVYFRGAEESEAVRHRAELDRALLEQQMDEARLQMLQAQIEPHFLFNTLATVRRLYRADPTAAESMLDNLMRYLAVALPQMSASDSTLGRETALAEAYLGIQQIRMGRRLRFAIEVPAELREARFPPMMLLTLTENAIKHGLNPLSQRRPSTAEFVLASSTAVQVSFRKRVAKILGVSANGFPRFTAAMRTWSCGEQTRVQPKRFWRFPTRLSRRRAACDPPRASYLKRARPPSSFLNPQSTSPTAVSTVIRFPVIVPAMWTSRVPEGLY